MNTPEDRLRRRVGDLARQKLQGDFSAYSIELCAVRRGNLATSCGLGLFARHSIHEVKGTLLHVRSAIEDATNEK